MRIPLGTVVAAALIAAGCGRHDARPSIGVALPVDSGALIAEIRRGLQRPADSLGFDLLVVSAGGDPARQAAQMESLVVRRVAALLIDPVDGAAIAPSVARANHAGVPVFTLAAPAGVGGGDVVSHIGSDERMSGELVGWYLAQRAQGGGNVAILDQPGVAIAQDRVAGLRLALSRYPNIRIVASPAT